MHILRTAITASAVATGFFGAMAAHRVAHQHVPTRSQRRVRDAAEVCATAARGALSAWLAEQAATAMTQPESRDAR